MMRALATAMAALFMGGCLQSSLLVKVNGDGSGTIEHRTLMTAAALAQLRQFAGAFGQADGKPVDPFSEDAARTAATRMGEGVTLVSSTPLTTSAGEGRTNVYQFRDITKLRVNDMPQAPGNLDVHAGDGGIDPSRAAITFDLARSPDGNVLLTLHGPGQPLNRNLTGGSGLGPAGPAQLAMLRQMLAGLRIGVQVEPVGRLIRTSSPFVDGATVTLFDLDFDQMMKDETVWTRLQNLKTPEDIAAAAKTVPGLRVNLEPDITIEFTPAR
jgi:hypothetical protein